MEYGRRGSALRRRPKAGRAPARGGRWVDSRGEGAGRGGSDERMTAENQPGSWVGRRGRGPSGQRVGVWSFGAVRRTDFYALRGEKRAVVGLGVVVADGQGPKTPAAWLLCDPGAARRGGTPPPGFAPAPGPAGAAPRAARRPVPGWERLWHGGGPQKAFLRWTRCGPEAGYTSSAGTPGSPAPLGKARKWLACSAWYRVCSPESI